MGNIIYLDHAGTTGVAEEVLELMIPYFSDKFGNASSVHAIGQEAKFAPVSYTHLTLPTKA